MPRQVPSAAPAMPRCSTSRKNASSATLRMDMKILRNMLSRVLPQMRRKLSTAKDDGGHRRTEAVDAQIGDRQEANSPSAPISAIISGAAA